MTIGRAIETVDRLRPNRFERVDKIRWLSELDALIWHDLIATHEQNAQCAPPEGWACTDCTGFIGYDEHTDDDTELLAAFPHDNIYQFWLESQIDLNNMEIAKYNNSRAMFNNAYVTYTDWYNRTHMPKQVGGFRFTERRKVLPDALST